MPLRKLKLVEANDGSYGGMVLDAFDRLGAEPRAEAKTALAPFWSDDFDMDLLKLYPTLQDALGATAAETVWTLGHTTRERLNHPTVWNTHGAFLWLSNPDLDRDARGWVRVLGCVTDAPLVECTWLEWLRDCWAHSFDFWLMPGCQVFKHPKLWRFERLMWHIRAWAKKPEAVTASAHAEVWDWLQTVNRRFAAQIEQDRLGRGEIAPYYSEGAVPGYNAAWPSAPPLPEFGSSPRAAKAQVQ